MRFNTIYMKRLLQAILLINLSLFFYGVYLQYVAHDTGYDKIFGIGTLLLVFVLLPLFLYYRYKDKRLEDYKFKGFQNDEKENE